MFKKIFNLIRSNQFILFFVVGGVTFISKILWTSVLIRFLPLKITYIISLTLTMIIGYLISYYFIFHNKNQTHKNTLYKYVLVFYVFSTIDYLIVIGLNSISGKHYLIGITISTIVVSIIKFFVYKKGVFYGWTNKNTFS